MEDLSSIPEGTKGILGFIGILGSDIEDRLHKRGYEK